MADGVMGADLVANLLSPLRGERSGEGVLHRPQGITRNLGARHPHP
jgi:hypothetical protein